MSRLLPPEVDNQYRGSKHAVWMLYLITLGNFFLAGVHVLLPDSGAQVIGTIPLDSFTADGATTVVAFVSQWGLKQGLTGVLCVVVLLRYRAMIPLMYLLLAVEQLGKIAIGMMKPVVTVETPPGAAITAAMTLLALLGFALSLRSRDEARAPSRASTESALSR